VGPFQAFLTLHLDAILALPRDIDHVRDVLFDLPMPFSLSRTNNEQFGPFIDNAYWIRHSDNVAFRKRDGRPAHVQHRVICQLKISRDTRDPSAKPLRLIESGKCHCRLHALNGLRAST
jgi:hypothetical protein